MSRLSRLLSLVLAFALFSLAARSAGAATVVVTSTADTGPGTLRQAMADANNSTACLSPCTIAFRIATNDPGFSGGVFTIRPTSSLPILTASDVTIDGATQTLATGDTNPNGPEIVIDGSLAPGHGLFLSGSGYRISNLVIHAFSNTNVLGATVDNSVFTGNYIGTDAAGSAAVGGGEGLAVIGMSNRVGGVTASERNIIANGVRIGGNNPGLTSSGNVVQGNYIGVDRTGTTVISTAFLAGIRVLGPSGSPGVQSNTIGGVSTGSGNVISGNASGVNITDAHNNSVIGNLIGTDAAGTAALPNTNAGVQLSGGASNNFIGGTSPGQGNVIAFNGKGVTVLGTAYMNLIRGNSIHSNAALGIDLGSDGVTPNDVGDSDTGPNALQNFPVLKTQTYDVSTNTTTVTGSLNSVPLSAFYIDFYSNSAIDPSGFGEGQTFERTVITNTDSTGNAPFSVAIPGNKRFITATASRENIQVNMETSEFSAFVNNAPVANPDAQVTNEDTAVVFDPRVNDGPDPEGDAFTITTSPPPTATNGTVTCSTTSCTFTPAANFNGTATVTYTVTDSFGAVSNPGLVTITVNPVNDAPVATNDSYSTNEDTPRMVVAPGVLANDTDVEGSPLSAVLVSGPTNGTVVLNADGSFTYTPNVNFNGVDSFTYQASDGTAQSNIATVTLNVGAVNDAPIAVNDSYTVSEDTPRTVPAPGVLANDTDADGNPLTAVLVTRPANGTVVLNSDGSFTYTPNANFSGTDSFTYQASDGTAQSNIATVTLSVSPVNDPPIAVNDFNSTLSGSPVTTNVLANDSDPEGQPLTIVSFTQGSNGTVSCATPNCIYAPVAGFTGTDSFTYTIQDSAGATATATVTISVGRSNQPPNAVDDNVSTLEGQPVAFNVLANDTDADGDQLTVTSFTQGAQGSVSCTPSGNCTYTPNSGATGSDDFVYKITDNKGGQDQATVFVMIVACPRAPTPIAPTDGAQNVPTSGRFEYGGDAEFFEIFYGPVGQGCSISRASTRFNFVPYEGLQPGTEYEWRVVGHHDTCPTVSSPCMRFRTLQTCTTAPPTPLTPTAGSRTSSPITFSWTAVPGATAYRVFAVGTPDVLLGTTTATSLRASLPDGTANWYVVALNVPGCGDLRSSTVTFTTCNTDAPIASVVGEATSGQTYHVRWGAIPGATHYELLEANNAAFNGAQSFIIQQPAGDNEVAVPFTKNTTNAVPFFYQVRAFSPCFNGFGAPSPTIRVVIVPVPPREQPNTSANAPVGSDRPIVMQVFVPGQPGVTLRFTARGDQEWMTVRPASGLLPPEGLTLDVLVDPADLPNGTFTGTVIVETFDIANNRLTTHATPPLQIPVSINLVTPVVPLSPGPPVPQSLIIPAVGHLDGADARWRSDVRIANIGASTRRYFVTFTPGNPSLGIKHTTIEVTPGTTTALDDIVRAWYGVGSLGESSNGMLEVRPLGGTGNLTEDALPSVSLATVVSSRTYAQTLAGTLGEFIPGVLFSRFVGLAEEGQASPILSLQQIAQNQSYRTNVGVVEASGKDVSTVLSIFNSAGQKLKDVPLGLKAYEQRQLNSLLAQQGITLADGRIEVRVIGGEGRVTAYAAVVDNRTKDQLFVPATTLGLISSSRYVMPGIADLNSASGIWRSDMRLFNSGSTAQTATLTLYPQNNSGAPRTASVTIDPGETEVLDNIVQTMFGATNLGGAVHVDTPAVSSLVVTARTYNQTTAGTLGLFIPAVTPAEAIGLNERTLNLVQLEDSVRYRTNLGVAEVTGKPVTLEVMVHLPDTKVTPRIEIPLAANEFRQIGILRDLGIGNVYNARLSMRVISGEGRATAYGSVIDMKTNDSTYVPAAQ